MAGCSGFFDAPNGGFGTLLAEAFTENEFELAGSLDEEALALSLSEVFELLAFLLSADFLLAFRGGGRIFIMSPLIWMLESGACTQTTCAIWEIFG